MTADTVRLHISPFTPDTLSSIIPAALTGAVENISFHSIQTFPEKSFGYVDLPRTEADRLGRRLHGSILKGKKMHIQDARLRKRRIEEPEQAQEMVAETGTLPVAKKTKRPKESSNVIEGHELSGDRKVRRGWTEPQKRDRRKKSSATKSEPPSSKYSEKEECLFRAKVPKNKIQVPESKDDEKHKKKKSKSKPSEQNLVHEFQNSTTFPSFLKDNTEHRTVAAMTTTFVDGKGWVDEDGNVLEAAHDTERAKVVPKYLPAAHVSSLSAQGDADSGSDASQMSSADNEQQGSHQSTRDPPIEEATSSSGTDLTSSSGESDDVSSDPDSEDASESRGGSREASQLPEPPSTTTTIQAEPHPLEALFKRPPPPPVKSVSSGSTRTDRSASRPSLEVSTSFSFFDPDVNDQDSTTAPMTPFTSQERRYRDTRSAAPTPDTAAPSRTSFFPGGSQQESASDIDSDEEEDMAIPLQDTWPSEESKGGASTTMRTTKEESSETATESHEQSEFTKWFYEHRGENNRLWKRRRREAAKEKRQAENRKSARSGGRR